MLDKRHTTHYHLSVSFAYWGLDLAAGVAKSHMFCQYLDLIARRRALGSDLDMVVPEELHTHTCELALLAFSTVWFIAAIEVRCNYLGNCDHTDIGPVLRKIAAIGAYLDVLDLMESSNQLVEAADNYLAQLIQIHGLAFASS